MNDIFVGTALEAAAGTLNGASNSLSTAVSKLNEQLKSLNIGLEVWISIGEDGCLGEVHLGYAKVGGVWGIALATGVDRSESCEHFKDAARRLRLQAVPHFGALFYAIQLEAEEVTKKLHASVQSLSEFNPEEDKL